MHAPIKTSLTNFDTENIIENCSAQIIKRLINHNQQKLVKSISERMQLSFMQAMSFMNEQLCYH